jgi:hypothetical protein
MTDSPFEIRREDIEFEYHRTLLSPHHKAIKLTSFHGRRLVGYGVPSELTSYYQPDKAIALAVLDVPYFFGADGSRGFRLKTVGDGVNYIKGLMSTVLFYDPENKGGEVFMRELAAEMVMIAIEMFYADIVFVSRSFPVPTDIYEVEIGQLDDASLSRVMKLPRTSEHESVYLEPRELATLPLYDISPSDERYAFKLHTPTPVPRRRAIVPKAPVAKPRSVRLMDEIEAS